MKQKHSHTSTTLLVVCAIFLIVLLARLAHLGTLPVNLNPDGADTLHTYFLLRYAKHLPLFALNWNGAPAINTYIIALFWEILGRTIFGLRFATALLSSASVALFFLLFYFLSKRLYLSAVVALSLSFNPWFFNFSRSSWENIYNCLYLGILLIGMYLYFCQKKIIAGVILISLGALFGFYGYHPGKLYILAVFITFVIYSLFSHPKTKHLKAFFAISACFFVFAFPQLFVFVRDHNVALDRIQHVSVFSYPAPMHAIMNNILNNILGFIFWDIHVFNGYLNLRYLPPNYPPINLTLLPFYIIGLIAAIKKYPFLGIVFFTTLLPVQIFSIGTPDAARGIHIVPLMYLFILFGIVWLEEILIKKQLKTSFFVLVCLLFLEIGYLDLTTYLRWVRLPSTLQAREPTVKQSDYFLWYHKLERSIQNGGWGFNVGDWNQYSTQQKHDLP